MTIKEIKEQLNVSELRFQESIDSTTGVTWHRYFNNEADNRFSIAMPDDVFHKLMEDRELNTLSLQYKGERVAKESAMIYKMYIIVIYQNVSATF